MPHNMGPYDFSD